MAESLHMWQYNDDEAVPAVGLWGLGLVNDACSVPIDLIYGGKSIANTIGHTGRWYMRVKERCQRRLGPSSGPSSCLLDDQFLFRFITGQLWNNLD